VQGLAVLVPVGLLGVAEGDVPKSVLTEEEPFEDGHGDEQFGWAELAEHAAAEALQVRLLAVAAGRGQQLAGAAPVVDGVVQGDPAVGQAVGDRSALGGVQAGGEQGGGDVVRERGAVPYLDREVRALDARQHAPGGRGAGGDDRVAVQAAAARQAGFDRVVVADPGEAVHGDRARRGGVAIADRGEALSHLPGVCEAHPWLDHQGSAGVGAADEVAEGHGHGDGLARRVSWL